MKFEVRDAEHFVNGWRDSDKAKEEKADCFVMALSMSTGASYDTAHQFAKQFFRRKDKKGTDVYVITRVFRKLHGVKFLLDTKYFTAKVLPLREIQVTKAIRGIKTKTAKTLKTFAADHKDGTYIIILHGHAITMIDGVVYDYLDKPKRGIKAAIKITECDVS